MKKTCRMIWTILFWIAFLIMAVMIFYASFQNGEASAEVGEDVIKRLAVEYFQKDTISAREMSQFTYHVRQLVRTVAFIGLGTIGTATIHLSFRRLPWLVRTLMAGSILVLFAWVTEKGKIYFPTRHYSYNQMMISIVSAMLGFLVVSAITLIGELVHYLHRNTEIPTHG